MKETTAKKRGLSSDRIFDIFNYALMAVIMIVVAYPLYYVLIASISNPYEVYAGHTGGHNLRGLCQGFQGARHRHGLP